MTKTDNRFVILLDLGYVLHHCNAEEVLIYLSGVNRCVNLREDRIYKPALITLSMELLKEPLFRLPLIAKRFAGDEVISVCFYSRVLFSNSICLNYMFTKNQVYFFV